MQAPTPPDDEFTEAPEVETEIGTEPEVQAVDSQAAAGRPEPEASTGPESDADGESRPEPQDLSPEAVEADAQIAELEEHITLVDAAMTHLDADDLEAAEAAVGQLDQGADPTLFATATPDQATAQATDNAPAQP